MFVGSLLGPKLLDLHRSNFSTTCLGPMLALDNGLDFDCTSAKFVESFRPSGLPALVTYTHVWQFAPLSATGVSVWGEHPFFLRRSLLCTICDMHERELPLFFSLWSHFFSCFEVVQLTVPVGPFFVAWPLPVSSH